MIAGGPPPFGKSQSAGYSETPCFASILDFLVGKRPRGVGLGGVPGLNFR